MSEFNNKLKNDKLNLQGTWHIICRDKQGNIKWEELFKNLVVNEGLNSTLGIMFHADTQISTWYIGLVDGASAPTYAAADTLASHAGWTENVNYTTDGDVDNQRIEYVEAAASGQSITNSANRAVFKVDTNTQTLAGALLCSQQDRTSSVGTLFSAGNFTTGNKTADSGDLLEVTYTISAASA